MRKSLGESDFGKGFHFLKSLCGCWSEKATASYYSPRQGFLAVHHALEKCWMGASLKTAPKQN